MTEIKDWQNQEKELTMNTMLGNTLREVCGPLGDLNQKLAGSNGEEWLSALKYFLRKENPWESTKKLALKYLKLVRDGIAIACEGFKREEFFKSSDSPRLWFGDNFKSWILSAIPEDVPAFRGELMKTELTKWLCDSDILQELGQPEPFTVSEFVAIVKTLIEHQPSGEAGTLLTNGYANIFYVKLANGRVVAVRANWNSGYAEWYLDAHDLGDYRWDAGYCVFSRS